MTERDDIIARLIGGEVIFLPRATWRSVQGLGSPRLYADVKAAGRYLHFVKHVESDGAEGLKVWVDDEPGRGGRRETRTHRLFADGRTVRKA